MLKWLMKLSYIPHNSSMVAIQEDLEGAWWIGHCEGSLGKPSVQPGTGGKKALHTWRLATCRLPSPQCSHIWGGTTCSPRLVQGTEDSACRMWAAHTASAGVPGLQTLHLIGYGGKEWWRNTWRIYLGSPGKLFQRRMEMGSGDAET